MSVAAAIPSDLAFQARSLYRALLRQSRQFAAYNFREYALRRTQDSFREHKNAAGKQIEELLHQGWADVRMLRRQTLVSQFFQLDKLVVERPKSAVTQSGSIKELAGKEETT